jgi:NitT/TauT family transport system substrate-binding protein
MSRLKRVNNQYCRIASIAAVAVLALAACGSSDSGDHSDEPGQLQARVGILKIGALTDLYVAGKEGMFKDHGLDVELIEFKSGNDAITAQRSGDVDIVLAIPGSAMAADENGFDLVAIMNNETARTPPPDSGALVVRADSDIQDYSDLAGKTVGQATMHSQAAVAAQAAIDMSGVDLGSIDFIETPYSSQLSVLQSGSADAVASVEPFVTQAVSTGVGRVIGYYYAESVPGMPIGSFWARKGWVAEHGEVVAAFQSGIEDAIEYMKSDDDRARDLVAEYTELDAEVVSSMVLPNWDYEVNIEAWEKTIDMMHEYKELKDDHEVAEYLSENIMKYASK